DLEESWRYTDSDGFRARLTTFMIAGECPECRGTRLNARSGAVLLKAPRSKLQDPEKGQGSRFQREGRVEDPPYITFPECVGLDVEEADEVARGAVAEHGRNEAVKEVVTGIEQRLEFLEETGLGYLTLDRDYSTLSGGEAQRVRL